MAGLRLGLAWLGWAGMGCLPSPAVRPPPSTWLPSLRASHPSHTHLATHPPSVPRLSSPALHLATHNSCGLVAAQALEEGRGHIEMVRGLGLAGPGWAWLGWAWLGWAGLDWARSSLGWAGLGLGGLGWAWLG